LTQLKAKLFVSGRLDTPLGSPSVGGSKSVCRVDQVLLHVIVVEQPLCVDAGGVGCGHSTPFVV
jgi:hypothetical protein